MMEVIVQDSIEYALKELKKRIGKDGIFLSLKLRESYPNLTDRAKAKERMAIRRRLQCERRATQRLKFGRSRKPKATQQSDIERWELQHKIDGDTQGPPGGQMPLTALI
jgi:ribosomal protein S21